MILKRLLISFSFLAFASYAFSSDVNRLPNTLEYKLDIRIDYSAKKLFGNCEITISNATDQPIEHVPILLNRLLHVKNIENENNVSLPFTQRVVSISGWEQIQVNFVEISLKKSFLRMNKVKLE